MVRQGHLALQEVQVWITYSAFGDEVLEKLEICLALEAETTRRRTKNQLQL
jgi:hypothetical protein